MRMSGVMRRRNQPRGRGSKRSGRTKFSRGRGQAKPIVPGGWPWGISARPSSRVVSPSRADAGIARVARERTPRGRRSRATRDRDARAPCSARAPHPPCGSCSGGWPSALLRSSSRRQAEARTRSRAATRTSRDPRGCHARSSPPPRTLRASRARGSDPVRRKPWCLRGRPSEPRLVSTSCASIPRRVVAPGVVWWPPLPGRSGAPLLLLPSGVLPLRPPPPSAARPPRPRPRAERRLPPPDAGLRLRRPPPAAPRLLLPRAGPLPRRPDTRPPPRQLGAGLLPLLPPDVVLRPPLPGAWSRLRPRAFVPPLQRPVVEPPLPRLAAPRLRPRVASPPRPLDVVPPRAPRDARRLPLLVSPRPARAPRRLRLFAAPLGPPDPRESERFSWGRAATP